MYFLLVSSGRGLRGGCAILANVGAEREEHGASSQGNTMMLVMSDVPICAKTPLAAQWGGAPLCL